MCNYVLCSLQSGCSLTTDRQFKPVCGWGEGAPRKHRLSMHDDFVVLMITFTLYSDVIEIYATVRMNKMEFEGVFRRSHE